MVVDELIRGGVRDVVLCPGSRNAPLAFALADADRAGRLRLHVRIDERTAGYLAIGLAAGSGRPVPIAMTSGTAVANLGPAVVEANYARVPLIVLSANRPYELLGTGANQTMEQLGYFGTQVRAAISLGLAEAGGPDAVNSGAQNAAWRSATCRVLAAATGARVPRVLAVGALDNGGVFAVHEAVAAGGLRVSADLMFGLDGQVVDELLDDASRLLDAGVEHLSCYALTIEPATRFGELARKGRLPRLADDAVASLYLALEAHLAARGWVHYEVSNYGAPGAESDHNRAYWRGDAYLGLGAGAVGCVPVAGQAGHALRWRNDADAPAYVRAVLAGEAPPGETEALDPDTRVRESLLLGMRTLEGTDLARVRAETGVDPRRGREAVLARQVAAGNVHDDGAVWRIPQGRWLLADDITARMF